MRLTLWSVSQSVSAGIVGGCAVVLAACGNDATSPAPASTPFYWQLQLNHHAVTLATVAPYDTIRLVATPLDAHGVPIATTARPVYTINDTSLTIDSTGLMRVHHTGSDIMNVTVAAALTIGGVHPLTLRDTAVVNIIAWTSPSAVPQMDSLLFRPVVGDSARRALNDAASYAGAQLLDNVQVKTSAGVPIPKAVVRYRSSDSLIASFATSFGGSTTAPQINAKSPGVVLLTAEATVYGRHRVDSLWYTVGYPLRVVCSYGSGEIVRSLNGQFVVPANFLSLGQLVVGQGGAVLWGNSIQGAGDNSLDVQFDDTTGIVGIPTPTVFPDGAVAAPIAIPAGLGGNIPAFPAAVMTTYFNIFRVILYDSTTSKARMFTQPGTYHWASSQRGISGTVTVVPNDSVYESFHPTMSR